MKRGILMTLPRSDDVTEYLAAFSKSIIDSCEQNLIRIKTLDKEKATKTNFEKTLDKLDFNMLIFNGHGSINSITGHRKEVIIQLGKNENILFGRITYARSCWFASGLATLSKTDQEGCFVGYNIPFRFLIDTRYATNPIKDNTAKIFFETSNLIPLGLIKGHSAKEADENSKKSMLKAINKALKNPTENSQAIAENLWNNYFGQVIVGNSDSKFI